LLISKEEITIRGRAYGIYEKAIKDFETSQIIEIQERVEKDINGKVYF